MRVLHVSHSAQPGGSNGVLLSLIRHAPAGTASACVFLEDGPSAREAAALGADVAIVETGRAREPWRAPGAVRRLRAAMRSAGADVVLAHVSKAHPYAWAAARLERIPEAWWQHEHPGQKPALQRVAGRLRATAVVCSARWVAEAQRERFASTPVEVIHPGTEVDDPPPAPRPHAPGPVVIGIVGRLQRWKRVELVLDAFPAIRAEVPGITLRVLGDAWRDLDADYPSELRDRAAALGVEDAVEFLGHVPDAPARMAELDILVHAAEHEPFGSVLVEAMLRGVPVVAPADGGPREIVRDGVDGLLVEPSDSTALAAAVSGLAHDPERRERMGAAGRERALAEFTAPVMAAQAHRLLARIAAVGPADGR